MKNLLVLLLVLFSCKILGQNVGINTNSPDQTLDVNGKLKVGDNATPPSPGTIRFNQATQDFEGWDGDNWRSLTQASAGWGSQSVTEDFKISVQNPDNLDENLEILGADHHGNRVVIRGRRHVLLYEYVDGILTLTEELDIQSQVDSQATFARTQDVAIHGSRIIVSINEDPTGGPTGFTNGRIIIYSRNSLGDWIVEANIGETGYQAEERFWGFRVAIHNSRAAIANLGTEDVEIYNRVVSWNLQQTVSAPANFGANMPLEMQLNLLVIGGGAEGVLYTYNGSSWVVGQDLAFGGSRNGFSSFLKMDRRLGDSGFETRIFIPDFEFASSDAGRLIFYEQLSDDSFEVAQIIEAVNGGVQSSFGRASDSVGDLLVASSVSSGANQAISRELVLFSRIADEWTYLATLKPSLDGDFISDTFITNSSDVLMFGEGYIFVYTNE